MSETTVEPEKAAEPETGAATETEAAAETTQLQSTRVGVDALVEGRQLSESIHDDTGVLLLAKGSTVTQSFKEKLLARNITGVIVGAADAAAMQLDELHGNLGDPESLFDDTHIERLDSIIDAGNLFVANSGPAVRDRLVLHGCTSYDPAARAEVLEMHHEASKELDGMLKQALHGDTIDSRQLTTYVGTYASALSEDPDSVMAVAAQLGKDASLADHCLKSTVLAMALGIELGLDDGNLRDLGLCGLMHDWGMIRVPESIRHAEHPLTPVEQMQVQKHPTQTLEILDKIPGIPKVVALTAYQVHERPNGSGYPRGRRGPHIHQFARILNVSDTYTALTTKRPHRPPLMPYSAMECLIRQANSGDVDGDVVRALLNVLSLFPISSFVLLEDGHVAQVLRRNGNHYTAPIVRLLADKEGNRYEADDQNAIVDLTEKGLKIVQALPSPQSGQVSLDESFMDNG